MATRFTLDTARTDIVFSVRHLVVARVRGRFTRFSGTLDLDAQDFAKSVATVDVEAASIITGDDARDEHLRSAEFLEAMRFPVMSFASREIERRTRYISVVGPLSLHGVTRDVAFEVQQLATTEGRVAFSARGAIDRRDFGLVWDQVLAVHGALVGFKVDIIVDLEASLAAPVEPPAPPAPAERERPTSPGR